MKKILVAEDESTLREGIATAFRERGWEVTEAPDGAEAVRHLDGRRSSTSSSTTTRCRTGAGSKS